MKSNLYERLQNVEVPPELAKVAADFLKMIQSEFDDIVQMRQELAQTAVDRLAESKTQLEDSYRAFGDSMKEFADTMGKATEVTRVSTHVTVPLARAFPLLEVSQGNDACAYVETHTDFIDVRGRPDKYLTSVQVKLDRDKTTLVTHCTDDDDFKMEGWPRICKTREEMIAAVTELRRAMRFAYLEFVERFDIDVLLHHFPKLQKVSKWSFRLDDIGIQHDVKTGWTIVTQLGTHEGRSVFGTALAVDEIKRRLQVKRLTLTMDTLRAKYPDRKIRSSSEGVRIECQADFIDDCGKDDTWLMDVNVALDKDDSFTVSFVVDDYKHFRMPGWPKTCKTTEEMIDAVGELLKELPKAYLVHVDRFWPQTLMHHFRADIQEVEDHIYTVGNVKIVHDYATGDTIVHNNAGHAATTRNNAETVAAIKLLRSK